MDCNKDRAVRVSFAHFANTRNTNGYAGCEKVADGRVWLQPQRPLTAGSIHYVTMSDPSNLLPPYGVEEVSSIKYPRMQRTLLITHILGDLCNTNCKYWIPSCPLAGFQAMYMLYFKHSREFPIPQIMSENTHVYRFCPLPTGTGVLPLFERVFEHLLGM